MDKIARKYFLPILLGSALIFAIDIVEAHATPAVPIDIKTFETASPFVRFEDEGFWSKFRDSVMKDKNKDKENTPQSPPGSNDSPQPPPHD